MTQPSTLYFGDNLDILRAHIADESIDLIYLDPPFNSKRDYNLLFKTPKGHESDGSAFPKIQILTIEGLLTKTESPLYPDLSRGSTTFKQAKTEKGKSKQGKLL